MDLQQTETQEQIQELGAAVERLKQNIGGVVIGQQQMVDLIIAALLADGHVLIEGVPGVAKTLTARLVAKSVSAPFARLQFTPDLMPGDVLGTLIFNPSDLQFSFRKGPVFSNIVLIDEINRAPAKTQAALFEVMEEKQASVDGNTYAMPQPFIVLATQNPVEQEGTYRLPEAQLDRFLVKVYSGYPTAEEELQMLKLQQHAIVQQLVDDVKPVLTIDEVLHYRQYINTLSVADNMLQYITSIVQATRNDSSIYLGASPRASLALVKMSRAFAAMQGRDFITPDDVNTVAQPVLAHRIIPSPEKEMEGVSAQDLVARILQRTEVPR